MSYQEILDILAQFNLYAWLIAAVVSLIVWRYTRTNGWALIMAGSLFVVLRQVWKLTPDYKVDQASELVFNAYMMRYVFGSTGALLLCIGFIMLIINYYVLQAKLEEL